MLFPGLPFPVVFLGFVYIWPILTTRKHFPLATSENTARLTNPTILQKTPKYHFAKYFNVAYLDAGERHNYSFEVTHAYWKTDHLYTSRLPSSTEPVRGVLSPCLSLTAKQFGKPPRGYCAFFAFLALSPFWLTGIPRPVLYHCVNNSITRISIRLVIANGRICFHRTHVIPEEPLHLPRKFAIDMLNFHILGRYSKYHPLSTKRRLRRPNKIK